MLNAADHKTIQYKILIVSEQYLNVTTVTLNLTEQSHMFGTKCSYICTILSITLVPRSKINNEKTALGPYVNPQVKVE